MRMYRRSNRKREWIIETVWGESRRDLFSFTCKAVTHCIKKAADAFRLSTALACRLLILMAKGGTFPFTEKRAAPFLSAASRFG